MAIEDEDIGAADFSSGDEIGFFEEFDVFVDCRVGEAAKFGKLADGVGLEAEVVDDLAAVLVGEGFEDSV